MNDKLQIEPEDVSPSFYLSYLRETCTLDKTKEKKVENEGAKNNVSRT